TAGSVTDSSPRERTNPARSSDSPFGNSRFHQLANECGWQASASRKFYGAFARLVSGQIGLECRDAITAHRVKRAMVRRRFEAGNELPLQAKCRHPVTDALLHAGRCSLDSATHLLERCAVFRRQAGQVFVNGLRLRRHEYSLLAVIAPRVRDVPLG